MTRATCILYALILLMVVLRALMRSYALPIRLKVMFPPLESRIYA